MRVELHLMDECNILKTVKVTSDKRYPDMALTNAWLELMVFLEDYVDKTPCYQYDMDSVSWSYVKRNASRARNMDISKDSIMEYHNEGFSVVWHELH